MTLGPLAQCTLISDVTNVAAHKRRVRVTLLGAVGVKGLVRSTKERYNKYLPYPGRGFRDVDAPCDEHLGQTRLDGIDSDSSVEWVYVSMHYPHVYLDQVANRCPLST